MYNKRATLQQPRFAHPVRTLLKLFQEFLDATTQGAHDNSRGVVKELTSLLHLLNITERIFKILLGRRLLLRMAHFLTWGWGLWWGLR